MKTPKLKCDKCKYFKILEQFNGLMFCDKLDCGFQHGIEAMEWSKTCGVKVKGFNY